MKPTAAAAAALLAIANQTASVAAAAVQPRETKSERDCCNALAKEEELAGKIFTKGDNVYEDRLETYYSANAALEPWCMVLPTSAEDVSAISRVISEEQCPFGMRSGAHSAWKGSNGIDEGITVDFGWLNATVYDEEKQVAQVGAGSNWEEVFKTLDPHGVIAVGGRASVVGVGGFTTGGGYSFHTNSRGFACDNVENFQVVLAGGEVVNANADENADLFKGLKGGSGNLGFVTRVDTRTYPGTQMWGGISTWNRTHRDELYRAYVNFADNMGSDAASQEIVSNLYDTANGHTIVAVLTNIDAEEEAPAFDEFMAVEAVDSTNRVGSVAELVPEFTGTTPLGLFANWQVGMCKNDVEAMTAIDDIYMEYVARMEEAAPDAEISLIQQFQPVTREFFDHGVESGGNVMGLEDVVADGPMAMWMFALTVDTEANQEIVLPIALEYRREVERQLEAKGLNSNWQFLNYAWKDQDPLAEYGPESVAHMQAASAKYDPEGVFQKLRKTGFKIPE